MPQDYDEDHEDIPWIPKRQKGTVPAHVEAIVRAGVPGILTTSSPAQHTHAKTIVYVGGVMDLTADIEAWLKELKVELGTELWAEVVAWKLAHFLAKETPGEYPTARRPGRHAR
jgi:hypothetical protein